MTSRWKCPPTSELKLLVLSNGNYVNEPSSLLVFQARREANMIIEAWAHKNRIDMKWSFSNDTNHGRSWSCGTVHSTNFEKETTQFPREFLDSFVGRPHPFLDSSLSMVLSTSSG